MCKIVISWNDSNSEWHIYVLISTLVWKQITFLLEPVCCKKRPKIVPDQLSTGFGNQGPLKVMNGTKLILDDHGNNLDSFRLSLESFRSFRGPLLHKPVTGQELFLLFLTSNPLYFPIWFAKFCLDLFIASHSCHFGDRWIVYWRVFRVRLPRAHSEAVIFVLSPILSNL